VWGLENGFDGSALRELAGLATATRSHEQGLIENALRELGTEAPPDLAAAGMGLAMRMCQQIASGAISPYNGASRIWAITDCCDWPAPLRPFIGYASEWDTDHHHYDNLIIAAAMRLLGHPTNTATVRFILTEEEFGEAINVKKSILTSRFYRIAGRIVSGLGAVLLLGIVWWQGVTSSHLFATEPATAVGLLLIVAFQLCVAMGLHEMKIWNRLINRFDQQREITIDDDGVKIARGTRARAKKWKDFAGFYESPSVFVLQTHGTQFWTIPKRAFEPGVEPIFYRLMTSKLRRK
jgi:hypothetical protein